MRTIQRAHHRHISYAACKLELAAWAMADAIPFPGVALTAGVRLKHTLSVGPTSSVAAHRGALSHGAATSQREHANHFERQLIDPR